jgi:tetratricopeptide (TPR) repeat protein
MKPKSELGYYNRGNLYLQQKNYKEAIADFKRTLKIEERFVEAHNQIALAYFRQKKYAEAWQEIKKAAEVNTTNAIVNENKVALENCIVKSKN